MFGGQLTITNSRDMQAHPMTTHIAEELINRIGATI
jgi:hypothetical protein